MSKCYGFTQKSFIALDNQVGKVTRSVKVALVWVTQDLL